MPSPIAVHRGSRGATRTISEPVLDDPTMLQPKAKANGIGSRKASVAGFAIPPSPEVHTDEPQRAPRKLSSFTGFTAADLDIGRCAESEGPGPVAAADHLGPRKPSLGPSLGVDAADARARKPSVSTETVDPVR
jgi:hypothetical protein